MAEQDRKGSSQNALPCGELKRSALNPCSNYLFKKPPELAKAIADPGTIPRNTCRIPTAHQSTAPALDHVLPCRCLPNDRTDQHPHPAAASSSAGRCCGVHGFYVPEVCLLTWKLSRRQVVVPQYRPKNTMSLIVGTPKKVLLMLGNPHMGTKKGEGSVLCSVEFGGL